MTLHDIVELICFDNAITWNCWNFAIIVAKLIFYESTSPYSYFTYIFITLYTGFD